jgi:hypothetical protein
MAARCWLSTLMAGGAMQKPDFLWQLRILGLLVAILLVALVVSLFMGQGGNSHANGQSPLSIAQEVQSGSTDDDPKDEEFTLSAVRDASWH